MDRFLRYALLASLALNLSFGIGLAWLVLRPTQAGDNIETPEARPMFRHDALRRVLPRERGALLDSVMALHRDAMRARMERLGAARSEVREAFKAEPFERARLDAAFAQLRETDRGTAEEAHALLGDLAERATPEERQRLARLFPNRHGRRGDHPPHPQPR